MVNERLKPVKDATTPATTDEINDKPCQPKPHLHVL